MTKKISLIRIYKRLSFPLMCLFVLLAMGYMTEGQKTLITCFSSYLWCYGAMGYFRFRFIDNKNPVPRKEGNRLPMD